MIPRILWIALVTIHAIIMVVTCCYYYSFTLCLIVDTPRFFFKLISYIYIICTCFTRWDCTATTAAEVFCMFLSGESGKPVANPGTLTSVNPYVWLDQKSCFWTWRNMKPTLSHPFPMKGRTKPCRRRSRDRFPGWRPRPWQRCSMLQWILQSSQPWCNAGCTTGGFFAEMFPPSPTMFACFAGQVVKNVGPLPCQGGDGPGAMLQWSLVAAHSTKGLLDLDNMDFELHCYLDSTKMH